MNAYASLKIKAGKKFLARGDVAILRVFSRWMYQTGKAKSDSLAGLTLPKRPDSERTAVPNRDVHTVLELSSTSREGIRDRAIMLLAATHGLRLNEVRELEFSDFDFRENTVSIRWATTKSKAGIRTIPLGRETISALDSYIKDERGPNPGPFFQTRHGAKFTYSGFSKVAWRLGQKLEAIGIHDFKFHRLRHSWATNYSHQPGVTMFDVQQVGGWRDVNSVRPYIAKRSVEELRRLPVVSYGTAAGRV